MKKYSIDGERRLIAHQQGAEPNRPKYVPPEEVRQSGGEVSKDESELAREFFEAGRKEVEDIRLRWPTLTKDQQETFKELEENYKNNVLKKFYELDVRREAADARSQKVIASAHAVIEGLRNLSQETAPVTFERQVMGNKDRKSFNPDSFYNGQLIEDANTIGTVDRPYYAGLHDRENEFRRNYGPILKNLEEHKSSLNPAERDLLTQAAQEWAQFTNWADGIYKSKATIVPKITANDNYDLAEAAIAKAEFVLGRTSDRFKGMTYDDRMVQKQWERISSDNIRGLSATPGTGQFRNESYIAIPKTNFHFVDAKGNVAEDFVLGKDSNPRGLDRVFFSNGQSSKQLPKLVLKSYLGRMTFEPKRDVKNPREIRYTLVEKVNAPDILAQAYKLADVVAGRTTLSADERANMIESITTKINTEYATAGLAVAETWKRAIGALPESERTDLQKLIHLSADGSKLEADTKQAVVLWKAEENRPWDPEIDGKTYVGMSEAQIRDGLAIMAQQGNPSAERQLRRFDAYTQSVVHAQDTLDAEERDQEKSRSDREALGILAGKIAREKGALLAPFKDGTLADKVNTLGGVVRSLNESIASWNANQHVQKENGPFKTQKARTFETELSGLQESMNDDQRLLFNALVSVQDGRIVLGDVEAELARRMPPVIENGPGAVPSGEVMVSFNSPAAVTESVAPPAPAVTEAPQPSRETWSEVATGEEVKTLSQKIVIPAALTGFDEKISGELIAASNEANHQIITALFDVQELSKGGNTSLAVDSLQRAYAATIRCMRSLDTAIPRAAEVYSTRFLGVPLPSPTRKGQLNQLLNTEKDVDAKLGAVYTLLRKIGGDNVVANMRDPSTFGTRDVRLTMMKASMSGNRGESLKIFSPQTYANFYGVTLPAIEIGEGGTKIVGIKPRRDSFNGR